MNKNNSRIRKTILRLKNYSMPPTRSILLYVAGLLILTGLIVAVVALSQSRQSNNYAELLKEELLGTHVKTESRAVVESSLGLTVEYNPDLFRTVEATVSRHQDYECPGHEYFLGCFYDGDEVHQKRPYAVVDFFPEGYDLLEGRYLGPHLRLVIPVVQDFWPKDVDPFSSDIDDLLTVLEENDIKNSIERYESDDTILSYEHNIYDTETERGKFRVIETTLTRSFSISRGQFEEKNIEYLTVQNGRPYYFNIVDIDEEPGLRPIFEALIKNTVYTEADLSEFVGDANNIEFVLTSHDGIQDDNSDASSNDDNAVDEVEDNIYTPYEIDENLIVPIIKMHPSTVRIGSINCYDFDLYLNDNTRFSTIENACIGGMGSGSFISGDGYIATNGHVTSSAPATILNDHILLDATSWEDVFDNARPILDFIVELDHTDFTLDDIELLKNAILGGDESAVHFISHLYQVIEQGGTGENIRTKNHQRKYAIQISDEPIRLDDNAESLDWKYTDKVIPAVFIDENYSALESESMDTTEYLDQSSYSDVAILKASGNFPYANLGNIPGGDSDNIIVALGFPVFVDKGASTEQERTVPTITQGRINIVFEIKSGFIIQTSAPISGGNSGGPAIDSQGLQIGLNTYGASPCSDGACFGDGIARDIADIKELVRKNNIQIIDSQISKDWEDGIDAFLTGNFDTAAKKFQAAYDAYPALYMAPSMIELAKNPPISSGGSDQTSLGYLSANIDNYPNLVLGLILLSLAMSGIAVVVITLLIRNSKKQPANSMYSNQPVNTLPNQQTQTYNQPNDTTPPQQTTYQQVSSQPDNSQYAAYQQAPQQNYVPPLGQQQQTYQAVAPSNQQAPQVFQPDTTAPPQQAPQVFQPTQSTESIEPTSQGQETITKNTPPTQKQ